MTRPRALRRTVLEAWKAGSKARTIKITGSSMKPLIQEGDIITFVPVAPAGNLKVGDIAVFQRGTGLIAHRIIQRSNRAGTVFFKERGDNMFFPAFLPANDVIGRVTRIQSGTAVINLDAWRWTLVNRALGCYWQAVCRTSEGMQAVKKRCFGNMKLSMASALYSKLMRFLMRLPHRLFRYK